MEVSSVSNGPVAVAVAQSDGERKTRAGLGMYHCCRQIDCRFAATDTLPRSRSRSRSRSLSIRYDDVVDGEALPRGLGIIVSRLI